MILTITGCASFSSKLLPSRSYVDITAFPSAKKINTLEYDVSVSINGKQTSEISGYNNVVEDVFTKSAVFNNFIPGNKNEGYHLSLNPNARYSPMGFALACGISIGTLGIIPTAFSVEYYLDATLSKDGKAIKTYSYHEYSRTWFHLSMLFMTKQKSQAVDKLIIENMILNLLFDMKKDGFI